MARYVDGFLIPVPKKKIEAYRQISKKASRVWLEYGALEYRECVAEDTRNRFGVSFEKAARVKPGETVVFSWIVYKSRAHRDKVNAKIMKDPRIAAMMKEDDQPFDPKRMAYGGFEVIVDAM